MPRAWATYSLRTESLTWNPATPSTARAVRPASSIAFLMASHDIDKVVRLEAFINAVPPTPTIQTRSDKRPIHHLAGGRKRSDVQMIGLLDVLAQQLFARRRL